MVHGPQNDAAFDRLPEPRKATEELLADNLNIEKMSRELSVRLEAIRSTEFSSNSLDDIQAAVFGRCPGAFKDRKLFIGESSGRFRRRRGVLDEGSNFDDALGEILANGVHFVDQLS
jgi:hypothetical protein